MNKEAIADGIVHEAPVDLQEALTASPTAKAAWQSLTPLSRNEWICWIITVKQQGTRDKHVKRAIEELQAGKRRPCCWMGCIHRTDKSISPSVQWVLSRQTKSST